MNIKTYSIVPKSKVSVKLLGHIFFAQRPGLNKTQHLFLKLIKRSIYGKHVSSKLHIHESRIPIYAHFHETQSGTVVKKCLSHRIRRHVH